MGVGAVGSPPRTEPGPATTPEAATLRAPESGVGGGATFALPELRHPGSPAAPPLPGTRLFPPMRTRDGVGGAGSGGRFRCGQGGGGGGGGRPGRAGSGRAGGAAAAEEQWVPGGRPGRTTAAMKKQFNRMKQLANQTVGRWAAGPGSLGRG